MDQRKTRIVTVKFSQGDYEKVERRAKRSNCKISTYIRDAAIAGTQRRELKDMCRMESIVRLQESANELNQFLCKSKDKDTVVLQGMVNEINEGVNALWESL